MQSPDSSGCMCVILLSCTNQMMTFRNVCASPVSYTLASSSRRFLVESENESRYMQFFSYSFALSETGVGYKGLAGVAGMTLFIACVPSFHCSPPHPHPHPPREAATDESCVAWETGTRLGLRLEMCPLHLHVVQASHCTHAMPQAFPPSLSH